MTTTKILRVRRNPYANKKTINAIEANIRKLEEIWRSEAQKTRNANKIANMPENKKKRVINKRQSYFAILRESRNHYTRPSQNGNNWSNNKNWSTQEFSGFKNGVPLVLYNNNGRYLGHVWVNGSKAKRSTGHFQGIQKTVNLNQNIINATRANNRPPPLPRIEVAPLLLNAAAAYFKSLGYTAMSTQAPIGKMPNKLNQAGFKNSHNNRNVYRKNL
jgi:hypothetical protein